MVDRFIIGYAITHKHTKNSILILNDYWYQNYQYINKIEPIAVISSYKYVFSHIPSYLQKYDIPIFFSNQQELDRIVEGQSIHIDILKNAIQIGQGLQQELIVDSNVIMKNNKRIYVKSSLKGENIKNCFQYGSDGIGLISTEFLFLNYPKISRDLQYKVLDNIFRNNPKTEYTIRLFDIDDDKVPMWFNLDTDKKTRGVSLLLTPKYKQILLMQLEAIMDLNDKYNVSILIPFINNLDEILLIREMINEFSRQKNIKVGVMLESTSSINMADKMVKYVDFFSIGTNDLVQSFFKIDRRNVLDIDSLNLHTSGFIDFLHHTKKLTHQVETRLCGQLPIMPDMVEILLSMGYCDFTISPFWIQYLKNKIKAM